MMKSLDSLAAGSENLPPPSHASIDDLLQALLNASKERQRMVHPQWLEQIQSIRGLNEDQKSIFRRCLEEPRARVCNLRKQLKTYFCDKDELIDLIIYCAVAQEPMVLFGEPGTAKTAMVKRFAGELGLDRFDPNTQKSSRGFYFEYLLTRFSEPDELFGPVKIKDLTKDQPRFNRHGTGMMPQAGVVFLDEIFRANSAILNALLSIVNERIIYEAGSALPAQTLVIFGAANDPPDSPEVNAFYERFLIRGLSKKVPQEKKDELFKLGWENERRALSVQTEPLSCLADLALLNRAILLEVFHESEEYRKAYCKNVEILSNHGMDICRIDDRKFIKLHKVICAKALIETGGAPQIKHQDILMHTWKDVDGRAPLRKSVIKCLGLNQADYPE
jgi:MoxR-like ATPase